MQWTKFYFIILNSLLFHQIVYSQKIYTVRKSESLKIKLQHYCIIAELNSWSLFSIIIYILSNFYIAGPFSAFLCLIRYWFIYSDTKQKYWFSGRLTRNNIQMYTFTSFLNENYFMFLIKETASCFNEKLLLI